MTTADSGSVFPLTTVWSPPAACPSVWGYIGSFCEPPHYSAVWATDEGYYSPGICFDGYTSGCDMAWRSAEPGETAVICVPSGWDCSGQFYATSYDGNRYASTVPAFEVRWVEDDLALFETDPLRPGETVATTTSRVVTTVEPVMTTTGNWPSTPEPTTTPSDDIDEDVDATRDEGDEEDTSGGGGVPTGAVAGIAVGVALFVAILCAVAFIWYRKRHAGPASADAKDALGGNGVSQTGTSQEVFGHYQFPGQPAVSYPNTMYAQPTQMMPIYQFPTDTSLPVQSYGSPPGVSHELAGEYFHTQADISELHAVSHTLMLAEPNAGTDSGTPGGNAQAEAKDVKPTQSSGAG